MEYDPIGDEVSVEGAIVQASQALDIAGTFATESRDTATLLDIASAWQKVADFIVDFSEHEAKMEEKSKKVEATFGFQPVRPEEDIPDSDDDFEIEVEEDEDAGSTSDVPDDGADEGESDPGNEGEHGELRNPQHRVQRRRLR